MKKFLILTSFSAVLITAGCTNNGMRSGSDPNGADRQRTQGDQMSRPEAQGQTAPPRQALSVRGQILEMETQRTPGDYNAGSNVRQLERKHGERWAENHREQARTVIRRRDTAVF